jgi:hypothetical protein
MSIRQPTAKERLYRVSTYVFQWTLVVVCHGCIFLSPIFEQIGALYEEFEE